MVERLIQSDRFAKLNTPLGDDVVVLSTLQGTERISDHFDWQIECLLNSGESEIDPSKIIGKPCHVEMKTNSGTVRYWHGVCCEIRFGGWKGGHMSYALSLKPWTWLLTRETSSEIFHEKTVKDIINQVLGDRGFSDFQFKLKKDYQPIPYCVQYQETTYDFISRLMEKYGLFFYFEHSDSEHKMIVVDDATSLPDIPGYSSEIRFQPESDSGIQDDRLFEWSISDKLRTATIDVDDYNYEKPNTALEKTGKAKDSPKHGYSTQTQYRYPTGHLEPAVGQLLADVFVDVERAGAQRKYCYGYAPLMSTGGVFTLADHPVNAENAKHFVVAADHYLAVNLGFSAMTQADGTSAYGADEDRYEGQYEVVDHTKAYKAPLKTKPPRIPGAQTAEVIKSKSAPNDEEIDVDDQGRILVKFHWNDKKADSDKCSCRVRVAQLWAGSGWGSVWIPRVGMEVVVEFLEGDPDRPLVTGCVYNGNNKSPIKFPSEKTQSTIKSQSSKGGTSADHFNQIRFEDKKDQEEIYIHAETDRKMVIERDDVIEIGERKDGGRTTTIKMDEKKTVTDGDETHDIEKGKRTTTIKMDDKRTITDGNDSHNINKGNQTTTIKMGNQKTDIKAGKGEVKAMQKYEIKVGGSKITIDPMSITLKAMTITIDASMNLKTKGGIGATHEAGAMMTIKGGMVMIN